MLAVVYSQMFRNAGERFNRFRVVAVGNGPILGHFMAFPDTDEGLARAEALAARINAAGGPRDPEAWAEMRLRSHQDAAIRDTFAPESSPMETVCMVGYGV